MAGPVEYGPTWASRQLPAGRSCRENFLAERLGRTGVGLEALPGITEAALARAGGSTPFLEGSGPSSASSKWVTLMAATRSTSSARGSWQQTAGPLSITSVGGSSE